MLAVGIHSPALTQRLEILCDSLVGGGDGHLPDRPIRLEQVDHAQVGQSRHGQARYTTKRLGHVEGLSQRCPGLDEQLNGYVVHVDWSIATGTRSRAGRLAIATIGPASTGSTGAHVYAHGAAGWRAVHLH